MPDIQFDLSEMDNIRSLWSEYSQMTKGDSLIKMHAVFTGAIQTGWTYRISTGFLEFLRARNAAIQEL